MRDGVLDPQLMKKYGLVIPVVEINRKKFFYSQLGGKAYIKEVDKFIKSVV